MKTNQILVTGGAGFIGNSLVKLLTRQKTNLVTVFDNFSVVNNLKDLNSDNLSIIKGDLSSPFDMEKLPRDFDTIFHLAADPEVRLTVTNSQSIFKNNIQATYNLLEWSKDTDVNKILFASSSTVYGDASLIPTPESYSCYPISLYGASKLACESLLSAYCQTYKKIGIAVRLANIVGPYSKHGIIFDMIYKLKKDSHNLEILGDGTQTKSYLHVDDCISGFLHMINTSKKMFNVYNLGSDTQITVTRIVDLILDELGYTNVKKNYTGGVDGGRGWVGDVKKMLLDITKIKNEGWNYSLNSDEAIKMTLREIKKQI